MDIPHTSLITGGPDNAGSAPLRFLVVDDVRINRMVIKAMLQQDGHETVLAENGQEAVEACQRQMPDVVLLDIMMPVMDGYEAARRIKALAGDHFVPVIMLTVLQDEAALARCIEVGADDFLTKPINRTLLRSKIDALLRTRRLYETLQRQNIALREHQAYIQREQEIAERVLAKVAHRGHLDSAGVRYLLSPMSLFNGDLLLGARRPSGGLHLLLGDFSGHGLSAAVGTMPVSEIFYSMSAKGYSIGDIVGEINRKLKLVLPSDMFFAACLLGFDAGMQSLAVWNGGLPEPLLVSGDGRIYGRFPSRHLPLGVCRSDQLTRTTDIASIQPGSRVYLFSDGLTEARNPAGEMFGQARVETLIGGGGRFDEVMAAVARHSGTGDQTDDVTFAEIDCDAARASVIRKTEEPASCPMAAGREWSMVLEFGASALREMDPLPALTNMLVDLDGFEEHKERLYLILAELFNNALDHGVLRLDSTLKNGPQGFAVYLQQRSEALKSLARGHVRVEVRHIPAEHGGKVLIVVEDSGPGFDATRPGEDLTANLGQAGRGMQMVRELCSEFRCVPPGNRVEATYEWK